MVIEIGLGLTGIVLAVNIIKSVRTNLILTKEMRKKDRRELMWRYGPFVMDKHVVLQHKAV